MFCKPNFPPLIAAIAVVAAAAITAGVNSASQDKANATNAANAEKANATTNSQWLAEMNMKKKADAAQEMQTKMSGLTGIVNSTPALKSAWTDIWGGK